MGYLFKEKKLYLVGGGKLLIAKEDDEEDVSALLV